MTHKPTTTEGLSLLYQRDVLDATDVCSNCFALVRVPRELRPRNPFARYKVSVKESPTQRHHLNTTVEYAPATRASKTRGIFCRCGVEGAHARVWSDDDVDPFRLAELTGSLMTTLSAKGVKFEFEGDLFAHTVAEVAALGFGVDEALSAAYALNDLPEPALAFLESRLGTREVAR